MNEAVIPLMWLLVMAASLLLLVFALEIWLGIWMTKATYLGGQVPITCVLIPAHDEAKTIAQAPLRLGAILDPSPRVVVVADTHLPSSPHVWWQRSWAFL